MLMEVPPDELWPRCVCPYCGPEPELPGGRRQCVTAVHPIVMAFTPGNILLCEECMTSCFRLMKRTKMVRKGDDVDNHTTETEVQVTQKGNCSSKNQQDEKGTELNETSKTVTAGTSGS